MIWNLHTDVLVLVVVGVVVDVLAAALSVLLLVGRQSEERQR